MKRSMTIKVITYTLGYGIAITIAILAFALGWWEALLYPAG